MKLIYKGKFNGDINSLPHIEHKSNAVMFKEFDSIKKFSVYANILSVLISGCLFVVFCSISSIKAFDFYGCLLALISLFPHELLHAVCFRKEVYLYTNLKQLMLFVVGTETMSKWRAVIMNALPNLVFGFIPLIVYVINPKFTLLGSMSIFTIGMGVGDYYNIYNIITQMPSKSRMYMYELSNYWYVPSTSQEENK